MAEHRRKESPRSATGLTLALGVTRTREYARALVGRPRTFPVHRPSGAAMGMVSCSERRIRATPERPHALHVSGVGRLRRGLNHKRGKVGLASQVKCKTAASRVSRLSGLTGASSRRRHTRLFTIGARRGYRLGWVVRLERG